MAYNVHLRTVSPFLSPPGQRCGVPQHYGVYYAISLALMAEAFMSATYHICPTNTNYQFGRRQSLVLVSHLIFCLLSVCLSVSVRFFMIVSPITDTTYMFIMAGLGIYQLVARRCPDILPSVSTAFFTLAVIIVLAVIGVVWHTPSSRMQ